MFLRSRYFVSRSRFLFFDNPQATLPNSQRIRSVDRKTRHAHARQLFVPERTQEDNQLGLGEVVSGSVYPSSADVLAKDHSLGTEPLCPPVRVRAAVTVCVAPAVGTCAWGRHGGR